MGRFLIVASRFNEMVTKCMVEGAKETLADGGVRESDVSVVWVSGSFELPIVAARAAKSKAFDSVICLGCVIRGETPHFDFVAGEAAAGIMRVGLDTGVPTIFGVLTTNTIEQALSRSGLKGGNKGRDAAATALTTLEAFKQVDQLTKSASH